MKSKNLVKFQLNIHFGYKLLLLFNIDSFILFFLSETKEKSRNLKHVLSSVSAPELRLDRKYIYRYTYLDSTLNSSSDNIFFNYFGEERNPS